MQVNPVEDGPGGSFLRGVNALCSRETSKTWGQARGISDWPQVVSRVEVAITLSPTFVVGFC